MTETPRVCPARQELEEFEAERLEDEAAQRIAEHVETCSRCRADLIEISADDRFAHELKELVPDVRAVPAAPRTAPDAASGETDPEFEALVSLLQETGQGERYEVLGELGHGGMAVVYEVRDLVLQRSLAMKVARSKVGKGSDGASPTGRRLARFLEEARITGQLHHPSIIPVHELGVDKEGRTFFTMSKVRGQNLREVFQEYESGEGDWSLQRLVGILELAGNALAYAHSKQVVHRDIKPANIMVGRFGVVYVMDWGLAKMLTEDREPPEKQAPGREGESMIWSSREAFDDEDSATPGPLTLEGEILGTPAYMPPEQSHGRLDALDRRADVYSMGAILYRLLAGRSPYDDRVEQPSPHATWACLSEGPPTPLAELAPRAPAELVAVCERAMARDRAERYDDMDGLTADLRAWLEGRVVSAHRTGTLVEVRKFCGRNRVLVGALALAFLLTLTAGIIATVSAVTARKNASARTKAQSFLVKQFQDIGVEGLSSDIRKNLLERYDALSSETAANGPGFDSEALFDPVALYAYVTEALGPHVYSPAIRKLADELSDYPLLQADLIEAFGKIQWRDGNYQDAERAQELALEIRKDNLPSDHSDITGSLNQLGLVWHEMGKQEKFYQQALLVMDRNRDKFGEDDWRYYAARHNVALALWYMGQREEALEQNLEILAWRGDRLGRNDSRTLATLYHVGMIQRELGQFGEARLRFDDYLERCREKYEGDEKHPNTLAGKDKLALTLRDEGDWLKDAGLEYKTSNYTPALDLHVDVLRIREDEYRVGHPQILLARDHLSVLLRSMGDLERAQELGEGHQEWFELTFGPEHKHTLDAMSNFAETLHAMKELAKARELLEHVLDVRQRVLRPDDRDRIVSLVALASVLADDGEEEAARGHTRNALALADRTSLPRSLALSRNLEKLAEHLGL